jgi:hemoglobin
MNKRYEKENIKDFDLEFLIKQINDVFYDLVYDDKWLFDIFGLVDIDHIKSQQTDFILGALGGPKRYGGRSPKDAHPHIFIQEDMWELREKYLIDAFTECEAPEWMTKKWIDIDNAFKKSILKNSPKDCEGRYRSDPLIIVPNPNGTKKSA